MLGHPRKKHQGWFDEVNEEIFSLLAEKRATHAPGSVIRIVLQNTTASRN